jgi:hypothetical protein
MKTKGNANIWVELTALALLKYNEKTIPSDSDTEVASARTCITKLFHKRNYLELKPTFF